MSIVSYAQNFEDVMLWRALGHVKDGFYIDVGAQHPIVDSVSKGFYEKGWRGIHVEATPVYAELLRQDRPDETVLQVALAAIPGMLTFYEVPETGLSTGDAQIASGHRERGFAVRELTVPCITLATLFAQASNRAIHWLKIDVEGMEREVLAGWGESEARPWIVVVESTLPNTQIETHEEWESLLTTRGYGFVYFDGLNRFYVSEKYTEFAAAFRAGPNVFDGFSLSGFGQTSFCSLINARADQQQESQRQVIACLQQERFECQRQREELEQQLTLQVRAAEKETQRLSSTLAMEGRAHTTRERTLVDLASEAAQKARVVQDDLLRTLVEREQDYARQLLEIQRETERQKTEQITQLKRESDERERALVALGSQASFKVESAQRAMVERERVFSEQITQIVNAATQEKFELSRLYGEQERSLYAELAKKERAFEAELLAAHEAVDQLRKKAAEQKIELSSQLASAEEKFSRDRREIEREFEKLKVDLAEENMSRCDAIRDHLALAEQALAKMTESSDRRDEKYTRESLIHTDWILKLERYIEKNEEKRLSRSKPIFRKFSPISLNIAVVARIHNLISILDAEINGNFGPQGIDMKSQIATRVNYQPIFEKNNSGIYDLDDFRSLYDRNFVRAAYLAILRREPDLDGESHYLKQVRAGVGKDEILDDILKSGEAKNYKTVIRGLRLARIIRKICKIPFLGQIFFAILFLFDVKNHLQDLRALENHVIRIAEESHNRFQDQIEKIQSSKN